VTCTTLPSGAQSFTVQLQGVDTTLRCTRTTSDLNCSDTLDTVDFNAGDQLGVRVDTPTGQLCKVSARLTESNGAAHNSVVYWNGSGSAPGNNTYCGPTQNGVECTANAVDASFIMPSTATLRRIAVHTNTNLGASETHTYTVRNLTQARDSLPSVASSLAGTVSGQCTTNCSFNAGDLVAVRLAISGSQTSVRRWISLEFDGIGTIALVGGPRANSTRYGMWGGRFLDTVQANTVYRAPAAARFRRLRAHSTVSIDTSQVRVCVGATNPPPCTAPLTCSLTVAADGARCADTVNTVSVNAGDYFQIRIGPQPLALVGGTIRAAFEIADPNS
jgi:hypothetical protein